VVTKYLLANLACLADLGVISLYPEPPLVPENRVTRLGFAAVTRAEMAAMLTRALASPATPL